MTAVNLGSVVNLSTVLPRDTVPPMGPPPLSKSHFWEQIAGHYRSEIRSARLRPGDELPAVRRMADEWRVGTNTSYKALALLRDEGWIVTRPGKAAVVADRHPA